MHGIGWTLFVEILDTLEIFLIPIENLYWINLALISTKFQETALYVE